MKHKSSCPEIIITGGLCKNHLTLFEEELEKVESQNIKELKVIRDSPGGDANVAVKIANHINRLKERIVNI